MIVECGFFSNAQEETLLSEEDYQEKAAQAICEGIRRYLGQDSDF
ncbi:MAG: N-acetylmuramoyl-L-alanine amidase [Clostridiales bacterium]|nr:N-acetylmuramoyl-L-alanine amidase [Clostridiales bacterium]